MAMDTLGEWLPDGLEQSSNVSSKSLSTPVVIDFGSAMTRIGLAGAASPAHSFASRAAKVRDRRNGGEMRSIVGSDVLLDPAARAAARSPFDGPLLTNWDAAESVLDYSLGLVGYEPGQTQIAISEPLLAPHLPHRTMQELLFEGYGATGVAFGADVLASAKRVSQRDTLLVFLGAEAVHVLPVVGGKPLISDARRIRWGGRAAAELLHELLVLKYPTFPAPVTGPEVEQMLRKHCFVAEDYRAAIRDALKLPGLEKFEVRVQVPVPVNEKSAEASEAAARQAERRRESGRRLQEQAAIARAERQRQQEEELAGLVALQERAAAAKADSGGSNEAADEVAMSAGFAHFAELQRTTRQLDKALRRARGEEIEDPPPDTPLLDVPDEALDADQRQQKRRERLLRASWDARQRAKAEKQARLDRAAAAEAEEEAWRTRDLEGWAAVKRAQLSEILAVIREREKLRRDPRLRFRHSLSAAVLPANGKRRTPDTRAQGDGEDYIDLDEEVEEERDWDAEANALQLQLLEHDETFSIDELKPQQDWRESTVHKFLWGAHPFDANDTTQQYQLNLNVERIRAVEPLFEPAIVGVDQAGLSEVVADLLRRTPTLASHVVLSGGFANVKGVAARLKRDITRALPEGTPVSVEVTSDPELDAWRGIAEWATDKRVYVSRAEYEENGADFVKEHAWGNPFH